MLKLNNQKQKSERRLSPPSTTFIKSGAGFTLLEIMMTIGIIMIIFLALGSLITNFSYLSNFIFARVGSQSEMNDVFARFVDELRRSAASANGAYVIQSASTSSLIFFSDILGDSNTERVRYFIDQNALKRGLIIASGSPMVYDTGTETILTLVKSLTVASSGIFSYYGTGSDASSTPLTYPLDVSKIRVLKISLSVNETIRGIKLIRTFTTAITPRSILFQ